ncbi:unnamed protein product, partial [Heterosigma akashiwo]
MEGIRKAFGGFGRKANQNPRSLSDASEPATTEQLTESERGSISGVSVPSDGSQTVQVDAQALLDLSRLVSALAAQNGIFLDDDESGVFSDDEMAGNERYRYSMNKVKQFLDDQDSPESREARTHLRDVEEYVQ